MYVYYTLFVYTIYYIFFVSSIQNISCWQISVRFGFWSLFLEKWRLLHTKYSCLQKINSLTLNKNAHWYFTLSSSLIFAHHRRWRSTVTRPRRELRAGRVIVHYACCTRKHGSGCSVSWLPSGTEIDRRKSSSREKCNGTNTR